ncbi:peptidoglycan-binding protein LysM [Membranicola marinus]|uniref:Potassium binding protein Kbp n=1 Tax=Membranihabitans marinus TaxID=1227546 RepID=A0A953L834_9BACT|nr:peptidoglycan-binding protein LysM [Membranihabitans marinus]MBY5957270.1 peptidoglycan-binding protein LysM [Membranihabitans marinus]
MGLFSFLKKAGSNLFGKDEETKSKETEKNAEERKALLINEVKSLNFNVENLSLELDEHKVTVYGKVDSQEEKEKVILALGNVTGVATVDDRLNVVNPKPESTFYEVKSGDSLSKIAKAHYGDPMKYPQIFEANKPMLTDPDKIYPGQVLRIPPLEA